jgi:L-cysteine:1D-myo-inositol 2-amino-2-deoxy-alpha-D-glucopyranoside ligase
MRLYDTARRSLVPFTPDGDVSLYVCGITPYDAAHLGHAFVYHVFDVFTRRMRSLGHTVNSVRNVTDVDDDILRVAAQRNISFTELADAQMRRFDEDMAAIGILPVSSAPRATQHVDEMVPWVSLLVDRGHAYERDGWVYFRVASDPGYGRLSHIDRAAMVALSRQRGANPDDPRKEDPLDFVLWQRSAAGEPSWDSPWGAGRPGWHIECTALSIAALGTPIDVHGGGDDLIFPHHECEVAQAEGCGVSPYVRHWLHVAMVRYQGEKMSKSLGNLVFVRELTQRVPHGAVRLLLASHHPRVSWEYEESMLREATSRHSTYLAALQHGAGLDSAQSAELQARFSACIDDDLNTPAALRVLDEAVAALQASPDGPPAAAISAAEVLGPMLEVIGVSLTPPEGAPRVRAGESGAAQRGDTR